MVASLDVYFAFCVDNNNGTSQFSYYYLLLLLVIIICYYYLLLFVKLFIFEYFESHVFETEDFKNNICFNNK